VNDDAQPDLLEAIDAEDGLEAWRLAQPVPPWADPNDPATVTVRDLAERAGISVEAMRDLLADEEERGNVEYDGAYWRASERLVTDYGRAFRELLP
jgi:hypothetical protein